jgi:hypothetical protein
MSGSSATVTLIPPGETPADSTVENPFSSKPLKGSYYIRCWQDETGYAETAVLSYNANSDTVYNAIIAQTACPELRNKIEVVQRHTWPEDGLDFLIHFKYVEQTVGQFELVNNGPFPDFTVKDSNLDPLSSDDFQLYIWSNELATRGPNVYYPVIPFEMIYTDETQPQVLVTVDNMPAVC